VAWRFDSGSSGTKRRRGWAREVRGGVAKPAVVKWRRGGGPKGVLRDEPVGGAGARGRRARGEGLGAVVRAEALGIRWRGSGRAWGAGRLGTRITGGVIGPSSPRAGHGDHGGRRPARRLDLLRGERNGGEA